MPSKPMTPQAEQPTPGPLSIEFYPADEFRGRCFLIHGPKGGYVGETKRKADAMLYRAAPDLHALALSVVSCVENGKPWRDCDHTDLIECLESFEAIARAAILKTKEDPARPNK